ncbi:hypothetical protein SteCoe_15470 [Stentor coeruleus]|uniref:C2H2-type domain-containing protein n=1 Tax=Stentor coeruleus TaxID=5963 RepID=A0A1R2C3H2_9CILI|nr:hypothetical protein SteCoe_15470 [Stentor coeruleus]
MENLQIKEDFPSIFSNSKIELKNINKVPYFCIPINENLDGSSPVPSFDIKKDYTSECLTLQEANEEFAVKIESLSIEIHEIKGKIVDMEKNKIPSKSKKYSISNKRDRRKSSQISRMFSCEVCGKSYGSEGSLNHHTKLKHFEFFQEQQIAKNLESTRKIHENIEN